MKLFLTSARPLLFALFLLLASIITAQAQTSAFTYQGRFTDASTPANGTYTMKFRLYGSLDQNDQVGAEQTVLVTATNGIFTVSLDFGAASFPAGADRWLEVQIGATTLAPRQKLGASPFAVRSLDSNKADGLSTICNPCVTDAQIVGLSGSKVSGSVANADNATSAINSLNLGGVAANNYLLKSGGAITGNLSVGGILSGDGSGLTNLPSGGGVSWQVFSGTTLQAQSNKAYITNNPAQVVITLPAAPNVGDVIRISNTGAGGFKLLQNAGQIIVRQRTYEPFTVWTPHEFNRQWTAVASSENGSKLVAAVGINGFIYTSNDYGVTWTQIPNTLGQWSALASSADGTKLAAAENQGRIWTSIDSGATWTPRETSRKWFSIASSTDGTKLAAVAYDAQIYTSTDSGVTWTPRETNRKWTTIASSADGTKLAAGADLLSPIYTSTDSGLTWSPNSGFTWMVSIASSYDGTKLVSAGAKGFNLYTSTDSGLNWVTRDSQRYWQRVSSSADGTTLAATATGSTGSPDRIYISTNSGVTWVPKDFPRSWGAVALSANANRAIAVVPGGQIYTSTYSSPFTTQPGTLGYLESKDVAAIEIQYIGNGEFVWLSHEGDIAAF
ncbi:MAG: hypothetical protein WA584_22040 [Pyrinomonadaceae bacterium]